MKRARDGRNGRAFGRRSGPRRTRTVFVLLAGEVHRFLCVGPIGPRGRGRTYRAKGAWVTARCRSTTATRGRGPLCRPCTGRCAAGTSHLMAISSVVKVLFGRDEPRHLCKSAPRTRRGAGSRTLSSAGLDAARLPVPRPFVCCRAYCVRSGNQKSRSSRKRLERSWTRESPVQTVEDAPLERTPRDIGWPKAACDVTRVANRPHRPSIHR